MNTDDIESRVIAIIAREAVLDPADIRLDQTPAQLGLDSLALVEMIFAFEEEFDIDVPFNANEPEKSAFDLETVGRIVEAIRQLVRAQG